MTLYMRDRENVKRGEYANKVAVVRKGKDEYDAEVLTKILKITDKQLERIIYYIDNNPEWDNEDIAEAIINDENADDGE